MQSGPDIRDALGHHLRRELLGALAARPEGLSLAELASSFPNAAVSVLSYHLHFLDRCGAASRSATPWRDGSLTWRYGADYARPETGASSSAPGSGPAARPRT